MDWPPFESLTTSWALDSPLSPSLPVESFTTRRQHLQHSRAKRLLEILTYQANSSHWTTKENKKRLGSWGFFFVLIQTLPTFWPTRILILRIYIFWDTKYLDSQIPKVLTLSESGGHFKHCSLAPKLQNLLIGVAYFTQWSNRVPFIRFGTLQLANLQLTKTSMICLRPWVLLGWRSSKLRLFIR